MRYTISKMEADVAREMFRIDGDKVKAIKYVREKSGAGLKEAKVAVEQDFPADGAVCIMDSKEALIQAYLDMAEKQAEVFQRMLDMIKES